MTRLDGATVHLTPRERSLVEGICDGLTNFEIAERLFTTLPTVKAQVSTLLGKLGVASRQEVVTWMAARRGEL